MTLPTESVIQQYIMTHLKRHPQFGKMFLVFAVPNQGFKGGNIYGARMKAEGMHAGVPDMLVLGTRGRVFWIELKRKGGRMSANQKSFHTFLKALDHEVVTITAETCEDGFTQVFDQLEAWRVV